MSDPTGLTARRGTVDDAEAIGRLLHDFNSEFGDPTPGPQKLRDRLRELLAEDEVTVFLAGAGPDAVAVLRLYPGIWSRALECYLAELYVAPNRRGQGLGRALVEAAIDFAREHGADYICLATGEKDVAARALYESLGFSTTEGKADGPVLLFYERDL